MNYSHVHLRFCPHSSLKFVCMALIPNTTHEISSLLQHISPVVMWPHNPSPNSLAKLYSHQLNFSPLICIFPQICRLCDRSLLTTRGGRFNPEGSGLSCACVSYCCGTVDTENLPNWRGEEAGQPKTTAGNAVSGEIEMRKHWTHNNTDV